MDNHILTKPLTLLEKTKMKQINSTSTLNSSAIFKPMQDKNTFFVSDLSGSLRDILESLQKLSKRNRCIVSVKTLVKISGYTRTTVQRALKRLGEKKYIRIKRRYDDNGRNLPSRYILIV